MGDWGCGEDNWRQEEALDVQGKSVWRSSKVDDRQNQMEELLEKFMTNATGIRISAAIGPEKKDSRKVSTSMDASCCLRDCVLKC